MKCPYIDCQEDGMMPPKKPYNSRPHGYCPSCKRKSRASFGGAGNEYVSYVVTSARRLGDSEKKKQHSVRYSDEREREIVFRGYESMQDFINRA